MVTSSSLCSRIRRDRIADIVAAETDRLQDGQSETDTWRARKLAGIERLRGASREVKIVALGDKLSNMRAIARDYSLIGERLWELFHAPDPSDHAWRYHALADALRELSNMRAIARDYSLIGDRLWELFHAPDPSDHAWRYHALADALCELSDTFAFREFESLVNQVFGTAHE